MAMIKINKNPSPRELRQFAGIWFPAFFAVVCFLTFRKTHSWPTITWIAIPVVIISIIGFAVPAFMKPIFLAWMYASYPIGFVVSHVVVAVIFFLVITPIGIIMKLIGRDAMTRAFDPNATTYWVEHDPGLNKARYFRQF